MPDVVVIGAGAAGLAAADVVLRAAKSVTVLEAGPAVGGLARTITVQGEPIEAYYHHVFPQDRETREVATDLGRERDLEWFKAPMAILDSERVHPFNGPLDVLRFPPLNLYERLRLALGSAAQIPRLGHSAVHRQSVSAAGPRWFGQRGYDVLWRPLLEAKFGPFAPEVAMGWLAARIVQRSAARRVGGDELGYVRGGVGSLLAAYGDHLANRGIDLRCSTPVRRLMRDGDGWRIAIGTAEGGGEIRAGAVVAAMSGGILGRLVDLPSDYKARMEAIPHRGVVCVLLELKRSVSPYYWISVTDRLGLGCVAIIEHTRFVPPDRYGGKTVMYLAHYVEFDSATWNASPDDLIAAVEPAFRILNPAFDRSWIDNVHVTRDRYAQPVPLVGGPMRDLPTATGLAGLSHVSLAHVYPADRGVSEAMRVGRGAGRQALEDLQVSW